MSLDPLHQFEIHKIYDLSVMGYDISLTNQSVWMLGTSFVLCLLMILGSVGAKRIPGRMQSFVEVTISFIQTMVKDTAGKEGLKLLPFVATIFLFIASLNLVGMIPGSFTSTSSLYINGALALAVFTLVWLIGLFKHGFKFFGMFCPEGTPILMMPLIIPLEVISFFARPATLTIRLAANMIAGHVLLKIFAFFCIAMGAYFAVPFLPLVAITALEIFVALLQAYIFTILTCVYLNDALNLH